MDYNDAVQGLQQIPKGIQALNDAVFQKAPAYVVNAMWNALPPQQKAQLQVMQTVAGNQITQAAQTPVGTAAQKIFAYQAPNTVGGTPFENPVSGMETGAAKAIMHGFSTSLPKYRLDAYQQAQDMFKAGASPKQIWKETAWELDPIHGVPVGEIHDKEIMPMVESSVKKAAGTIADINHKFTDASDLRVFMNNMKGTIDQAIGKFREVHKRWPHTEAIAIASQNGKNEIRAMHRDAISPTIAGLDPKGKVSKLSEVFPHTDLFEMFPQMKDFEIKFDPKLGPVSRGGFRFDPASGKGTILINPALAKDPEQLARTVYHEATHGIQQLQDLPKGGSPSWVTQTKAFKNVESDLRQKVNDIRDKYTKKGISSHDIFSGKVLTPEEKKIVDTFNLVSSPSEFGRFGAYRSLHGEAYANLSGKRFNWTEAQRQETSPSEHLNKLLEDYRSSGMNPIDFYGHPDYLLYHEGKSKFIPGSK